MSRLELQPRSQAKLGLWFEAVSKPWTSKGDLIHFLTQSYGSKTQNVKSILYFSILSGKCLCTFLDSRTSPSIHLATWLILWSKYQGFSRQILGWITRTFCQVWSGISKLYWIDFCWWYIYQIFFTQFVHYPYDVKYSWEVSFKEKNIFEQFTGGWCHSHLF